MVEKKKKKLKGRFDELCLCKPIASMYGIFSYIYHKINQMSANIPYRDGMGKVLSHATLAKEMILPILVKRQHPCSFQILEPTWQHWEGRHKPINVLTYSRSFVKLC